MRTVLIAAVAAAVALAAGGAAAYAQRDRLLEDDPEAPPEEAPVELGAFHEMEGVVINPRGTAGQRYLMVKVGVEAESEKTLDRLKDIDPAARDAVLTLLADQTVSQLSDVTRRDTLKEQIRADLNRLLGEDGEVSRIYFTQYVLQ